MSTVYHDPALLIAEVAQQGISLSVNGDHLKVRGPNVEVKRWAPTLKENKPTILAYLRQCHQPEPGPRPAGDFTATTDATLGHAAPDPAGVEPLEHQHHDIKLHPTHRTTAPLLFHQPGRGPFVIEAGTMVHAFPSLFAAQSAGLPTGAWEGLGQWAAQKNVEKGYRLAWIANDLRGIYPEHLEELDE